jgi:hypothetical protein
MDGFSHSSARIVTVSAIIEKAVVRGVLVSDMCFDS